MKHRASFTAALIPAAVLFPFAARAETRVVTIFSGVSAASGSYTDSRGNAAERTAGYLHVRFQVCGTGFSGTVTASQGALATTTTTVKTLTLSGVTGCSAANYIRLNPAAWTGFSYTRSGGSVSVYLELLP